MLINDRAAVPQVRHVDQQLQKEQQDFRLTIAQENILGFSPPALEAEAMQVTRQLSFLAL